MFVTPTDDMSTICSYVRSTKREGFALLASPRIVPSSSWPPTLPPTRSNSASKQRWKPIFTISNLQKETSKAVKNARRNDRMRGKDAMISRNENKRWLKKHQHEHPQGIAYVERRMLNHSLACILSRRTTYSELLKQSPFYLKFFEQTDMLKLEDTD